MISKSQLGMVYVGIEVRRSPLPAARMGLAASEAVANSLGFSSVP